SDSGEPFAAEILPVPVCADGLVDDLVQPFDHLVAEFERRIEPDRRAFLARHLTAIAGPAERPGGPGPRRGLTGSTSPSGSRRVTGTHRLTAANCVFACAATCHVPLPSPATTSRRTANSSPIGFAPKSRIRTSSTGSR